MNIADLIFPKFCTSCGRTGSYLCRACRAKKLQPYPVHFCHVCRTESRKYPVHKNCIELTWLKQGVDVGLVYCEVLEQLLVSAKYSYYHDLLGVLSGLLCTNLKLSKLLESADVITYVPSSVRKKRLRG